MTGVPSRSMPLRVLCVHNAYQHAGGEDSVFRNETALLEAAGHVVERFLVSNDEISGPIGRIRTALTASYSLRGRRMISDKIKEFRPGVVHVHNFFPQLSLAIFDACSDAGIASVWTLHNFRVACANGLLFRDGKVCEDCIGRLPAPAVRHRCYRNSYVGTAAVAAMIGYHSLRGTWHHKVERFIALNDFARDVFVRSGLPADRVVIKPNFSPPLPEPTSRGERRGALFVGRLSKEKGVHTLVEAWARLDVPLTIIGDGPKRAEVEAMFAILPPQRLTWLGEASSERIATELSLGGIYVWPGCGEAYGLAYLEAQAAGLPVVAQATAGVPEVVMDGKSGILTREGDAIAFAGAVARLLDHPDQRRAMGLAAKDFVFNERSLSAASRRLDIILQQHLGERYGR